MLGEQFDSILRAAKEGADWAWAEIYRDLVGQVTGYLASRGARHPEDVGAETFLHAARGIHSFEGDEQAFRSWVFVIAHRRLIDERRRAGRRPVEVEWNAITAAGFAGGDVEVEAVDELVTSELRDAFDRLTDEQRDVLALRIIGDLSLEETASVVGKRVGAVKALQRRALQALRKVIESGSVTL